MRDLRAFFDKLWQQQICTKVASDLLVASGQPSHEVRRRIIDIFYFLPTYSRTAQGMRFAMFSFIAPVPFRKVLASSKLQSSHRRPFTMAQTVPKVSSSSPPSPISVIGAGGNMATSLISGLLTHPAPPTIHASSRQSASMAHLPIPDSRKYTDNMTAIADAELILLCVKPPMISTILAQLAPILKETQTPVLSVAAGITTHTMEKVLISEIGMATPVLRAMPNTPSTYSAGVTALCKGSTASDEHLEMATAALSAVGDVVKIPESLFSAATAVAGCGPAYLFMMAEAMADAGVKCGLPRDVAIRMAAGTVQGSGVLLLEEHKQGIHPAVLRNRVESPGGVTVRATSQLEKAGFRAAVIDAVVTAFETAQKMSEN